MVEVVVGALVVIVVPSIFPAVEVVLIATVAVLEILLLVAVVVLVVIVLVVVGVVKEVVLVVEGAVWVIRSVLVLSVPCKLETVLSKSSHVKSDFSL